MSVETACNLDKAYIREVLVAAGLYDDGSLDNKATARVDSMARPICDDIFEEVEDMYYYSCIGMYSDAGGNATDHRMLFDLANEALLSLVQGARTGSSLRQWVIDSTGASRGRRLVHDVWQQVSDLDENNRHACCIVNHLFLPELCFSQISGANTKESPNAGDADNR